MLASFKMFSSANIKRANKYAIRGTTVNFDISYGRIPPIISGRTLRYAYAFTFLSLSQKTQIVGPICEKPLPWRSVAVMAG